VLRELKLFRDSWCIKNDGEWRELDFEDIYSSSLLEEINLCKHRPCSDYVNELFLYHYVKCKEIKEAVGDVGKASYCWGSRLADKGILFNLRKNSGFKVDLIRIIFFHLQVIITFVFSIFSAIFISAFLPFVFLRKGGGRNSSFKNKVKFSKNIFLVRSKSGYTRAKVFISEDSDCLVLVDNFSGIKVPGHSIYSVLWSLSFPRIYTKALWYTVRDFWLLYKDARGLLGTWSALSLFLEYWKRIPQKTLYEACFSEILNRIPEKAELFSGEKEDRFALMQTRRCEQRGVRLTCLPHGLEYGFRFPGGLCGDLFYCFSKNAKEVLELIYASRKFLYSDDALNKMLGIVGGTSKNPIDRVCFFTEPRDQHVNFEIIDQLTRLGVKLSIKLHPLESQKSYQERYPGIDIIRDLEDALSSSACLSRKSTVLIEASQRGKLAIALLLNKKDQFYVDNLFPSLSSEKIVKIYNCKDLVQVLAVHNNGQKNDI
jgi:hypothetical protein